MMRRTHPLSQRRRFGWCFRKSWIVPYEQPMVTVALVAVVALQLQPWHFPLSFAFLQTRHRRSSQVRHPHSLVPHWTLPPPNPSPIQVYDFAPTPAKVPLALDPWFECAGARDPPTTSWIWVTLVDHLRPQWCDASRLCCGMPDVHGSSCCSWNLEEESSLVVQDS